METNSRTASLVSLALMWMLLFFSPAAVFAEGAGRYNKPSSSPGNEAMQRPDAPTGLRIVGTKPSAEKPNEKTQNLALEIDQVLDKVARSLRGMAVIENRIPKAIIDNAAGVALLPEMNKAGVLVGSQYGNGILMLKSKNGWRGPIFISLFGASFGQQIGLEPTDIFMVFTNREALDELQKGQLTLGAEMSVAAGTFGTKSGVSTDADVQVYKKTEGLFAGLSVSSARLKMNEPANETYFQNKETGRAYYGGDKPPIDIESVSRDRRVEQMVTILSDWN